MDLFNSIEFNFEEFKKNTEKYDINTLDEFGNNVLNYMGTDYQDEFDLSIQLGIDINHINNDGETPLDNAVSYSNNHYVVNSLIYLGAKFNHKNSVCFVEQYYPEFYNPELFNNTCTHTILTDKFYKKQKAYINHLSLDKKEIIRSYIITNYKLNNELENKKIKRQSERGDSFLKSFYEIIENAPILDKDIVVFRGTNMHNREYTRTGCRIGGLWNGFCNMSTSTNIENALTWGSKGVFDILVPKGTPVLCIECYDTNYNKVIKKGESEIILPANRQIYITDVFEDMGRPDWRLKHIKGELINHRLKDDEKLNTKYRGHY